MNAGTDTQLLISLVQTSTFPLQSPCFIESNGGVTIPKAFTCEIAHTFSFGPFFLLQSSANAIGNHNPIVLGSLTIQHLYCLLPKPEGRLREVLHLQRTLMSASAVKQTLIPLYISLAVAQAPQISIVSVVEFVQLQIPSLSIDSPSFEVDIVKMKSFFICFVTRRCYDIVMVSKPFALNKERVAPEFNSIAATGLYLFLDPDHLRLDSFRLQNSLVRTSKHSNCVMCTSFQSILSYS